MVLNLLKYTVCVITFHSCILTVVVGMDDLGQGNPGQGEALKRKFGVLTRRQAQDSSIVVPEIKDVPELVTRKKKVKASRQLTRSYTMNYWAAAGGGAANVVVSIDDMTSIDSRSSAAFSQSSNAASPRYVDRTTSLQKRLEAKEAAYQAAIAAAESVVTESDTDADISIASSNDSTPQKSRKVQINAVSPLIRQFTYDGKENPIKVPVYDAEQRVKSGEKRKNKAARKANAHISWLTYDDMKDHQAFHEFNSEIGKVRSSLMKISTQISTDSQDEDVQNRITEFNACIDSVNLKVFCRDLSRDYSANRGVPIDKEKHANLMTGIFDDVVARLDACVARLATSGVDFDRVNFGFDAGMTYYRKQKNRLDGALFKFIGYNVSVLEKSETLHGR